MSDWKKELNKWIAYPDLDVLLKEELERLLLDPAANADDLEESFFKDLEFGTGGLRGVLGAGSNRLNIYTIRKATQGVADYIKKELKANNPAVAVGYDSRVNSRLFAEEASCVLVANGIRTYMYDTLYPAPGLVYALRHYGCEMGIMITASHNPAKYNGYKVYGAGGYQATDEASKKILEKMQQVDIFEGALRVSFDEAQKSPLFSFIGDEIKQLYIDRVMQEAIFWTESDKEIAEAMGNLKVTYTPLNGTGAQPVKEVMKRLAIGEINVVKEQEEPDGAFPTCPYPNPENKDALLLAIKLFEETGADILVGTDPDCDRMGIAVRTKSGECRLLTGNETGLLMFDYIIRNRIKNNKMPNDPIAVRTIVSSRLIDKIAAANNIDLKITLTGFKYIGEAIEQLERMGKESSYIFGYEESYGYLTGTYVRDKDGVNASLLVFCLAAEAKAKGTTLDCELERIYQKYGYSRNDLMNFTFEGISGMREMDAIMEFFRTSRPAEIAGKKVNRIIDYKNDDTGLPKSNVIEYILEGECGFLVRPSGTEPKLKIYIHTGSSTKQETDATAEILKKALNIQEKK
ncbi:MAG: phospho-sugar mutase [Eubacteriales bacterium]|nr:phospho-sugar mutase [Eubacteriales bacterium]MDD4390257.1 phospho-sugar mutase [Eubacteriales bacterium]